MKRTIATLLAGIAILIGSIASAPVASAEDDRVCIKSSSSAYAYINMYYWDSTGRTSLMEKLTRYECSDDWRDEEMSHFFVGTGYKCQSPWGYWYRAGTLYWTSKIDGTLYLWCIKA